MSNILTRNPKNKLIALAFAAVIYGGLQILSVTALKEVYVFEWLGHNFYGYTWIAVLILIAFDQTTVACFMTFGNLIGAIIGQFLGDFIQGQRMSRITPDMSEEQRYLLSTHYGVFIWAFVLLGFAVLGIIFAVVPRIRRKQKSA